MDMVLDQFWRCPVCGAGMAMGRPAVITSPPVCHAHGEMEQCTADGFKADLDDHTRPEEG